MSIFFGKEATMKTSVRYLMGTLAVGAMLSANNVWAQTNESEEAGEVLFKVHDIIPEKDADGNVVYCNMGATFFNRTKQNITNAALKLVWLDEVVSDVIDQEERAEKEAQRINSKQARNRYPTSSITDENIEASLKLPQIKANQQVSLKTKVDTDRCFLLLNDMDVEVVNCGTAGAGAGVANRQSCNNLFRFVSPKMPEYYTEFKEISLEEQLKNEAEEVVKGEKEVIEVYENTLNILRNTASGAINN